MSMEAKRLSAPPLESGFHNEPETVIEPRLFVFPTISRTARIGRWIAPLLLLAMDYVVIVCSLLIANGIRMGFKSWFDVIQPFSLDSGTLFITIPLIFIGFISFEKLYTKRLPFWQSAEKLFKITTYAMVLLIGMMYFSGQIKTFSRLFVLIDWMVTFIGLTCGRFAMKRIMVVTGLWRSPVIFVGSVKTAELIDRAFKEEIHMGYEIVGVIDDSPQTGKGPKYPVYRNLYDAEFMIKSSKIQDVIIAAEGLPKAKLLDLIYRIQPLVKNLAVVPDLIGVPMSNMEVNTLLNQQAILLNVKNNLANRWNGLFKRVFDLTAGLLICIPLLPVMTLIWLWIRLDSRGPACYNAKRIGKNGREFICYKFRSMHLNGDDMLEAFLATNPEAKSEWERFCKLKTHDPRLTKVGRFLRQYSLDELPQIFNVLKGEMSLVGPRPYLPREREIMGVFYETIIQTVPGITGLWQTQGRNDVTFEGRLNLDSWYVRNWSFWLDVTLLLKTVEVVAGKRGAF